MAVKVKEGFLFFDGDSMVVICGDSQDELKEMGKSMKFK